MYSKVAILPVVVAALMVFSGFAFASPPVPPPTEGFVITTAVDCEMSAGDFSEAESFTWTWVHDPVRIMNTLPIAPNQDENHVGRRLLLGSTLGFPGTDQRLGPFGRAAQIRYAERCNPRILPSSSSRRALVPAPRLTPMSPLRETTAMWLRKQAS